MNDMEVGKSGIVGRLCSWIKELEADIGGVVDAASAGEMEERVREGGRVFLAQLLESLLNKAAAQMAEKCRQCTCQSRRRHKGERARTVVTSVGPVQLRGVLFRCPSCGLTANPVEKLIESSFSPEMERMLCLLGTSIASFEKAGEACHRLLGVGVSADSIRRVCQRHGRRLARRKTSFEPFEKKEAIKAGLDGTMVNTRQDQWRELKAYRFQGAHAAAGGATLRRIERFERHVESVGRALNVGAGSVFVTDAALWIQRVVKERFPAARHIVDYWHACQHIHTAAKEMYGDGSSKALAWAAVWCRKLRTLGGEATNRELRALILTTPEHERPLDQLWRYLNNNKTRMNYPDYERRGLPISSGSMESFCKQLGQRLKGPGMRWHLHSVDPMACLVSHWTLGQWDAAWSSAA